MHHFVTKLAFKKEKKLASTIDVKIEEPRHNFNLKDRGIRGAEEEGENKGSRGGGG